MLLYYRYTSRQSLSGKWYKRKMLWKWGFHIAIKRWWCERRGIFNLHHQSTFVTFYLIFFFEKKNKKNQNSKSDKLTVCLPIHFFRWQTSYVNELIYWIKENLLYTSTPFYKHFIWVKQNDVVIFANILSHSSTKKTFNFLSMSLMYTRSVNI